MNIQSTAAASPFSQKRPAPPQGGSIGGPQDSSDFGFTDRVKVGLFSALPLAGTMVHGSRFVDAFSETHHEGRFAMLNLVTGAGANVGGMAALLEYAQTGNKLGLWLGLGCLAASGITAAALVNEDNLHKYI